MDMAERVSLRAGTKPLEPAVVYTLDHEEPENHGPEGFDIMANVIWPEVAQAIMDELGAVVFAVGKPDEFLKVSALLQALTDGHDFFSVTQPPKRLSGHWSL